MVFILSDIRHWLYWAEINSNKAFVFSFFLGKLLKLRVCSISAMSLLMDPGGLAHLPMAGFLQTMLTVVGK